MIDRDRVHRTTIDETGRHDKYQEWKLTLSEAVQFAETDEEKVWYADVMRFTAKEGFHGEDADRAAYAASDTTRFLQTRVAAADKPRYRNKKREKRRLVQACMDQAGVPQATWTDWMLRVLTLGSYVAPPPWNVVITAVLWAVERYLGGGEA